MSTFQYINNRYNSSMSRLALFFSKRSVILATAIIYKALFDFLYFFRIANHMTGYFCYPNAINIVVGWTVIPAIAAALNCLYKQKTASSIMMTLLVAIYFIPMLVMCDFGGGTSSFLFFGILYMALLFFLQIKTPVYALRSYINSPKGDRVIWGFMLFFVSTISIYCWVKYSNFHLQTDLYNVYELRAEAAGYHIPSALLYMRQWAIMITAILIIRALRNRRWIQMIYLLFIVWISFSFAADKSVALFPLLLIGGYLFYREDMISMIIPGLIILQVIAFVLDTVGINWLKAFIFTRMGVALPMLSQYTYKFFLGHPTDLFRQGIMGKLGFHSIYGFLPNVIGNNYIEQSINCNNGMLSDVWSSFGYIGIIIMPIILIACFRLMDAATFRVDNRQTVGLLLFFAICFANAMWSTVLLTQGYLIASASLFFFPRTNSRKVICNEDSSC